MDTNMIALSKEALVLTLLVSAPLLAAGLVVGVLVSLVQAVTQIQEMTLTFIPKVLAVSAALFFFLPWMLTTLVQFTLHVFEALPYVFQGGGA